MENEIAKKIRAERLKKGLTQEEFADKMGVTKAAVSKWETGDCYPDIITIPKIAAFFGISLDELFSYRNSALPDTENKKYSVGLYMSQLTDTTILDLVNFERVEVYKHCKSEGVHYYDTTVFGSSRAPDFLEKLQKALKPGIFSDVLETVEKDGSTEISHCWGCDQGILRFRPGDTVGIRRALEALHQWGIAVEDD